MRRSAEGLRQVSEHPTRVHEEYLQTPTSATSVAVAASSAVPALGEHVVESFTGRVEEEGFT
jgi:hypothetical protein